MNKAYPRIMTIMITNHQYLKIQGKTIHKFS